MSSDANFSRTAAFYDAAWSSEQPSCFADYPRNLLLARATRGWKGAGQTLVDVGCGPGTVAAYFSRLGYSVGGVDASPVAIERARKDVPTGSFHVGNVEEPLPFASGSTDVVFWGDNVEHLFEPLRTLHEIRRILKPSGQLILTCPNIAFWKFRLFYLLHGSPPRTEGHANPPWSWEHIRFFNPGILRTFLRTGGFSVTEMTGTMDRRKPDFLSRNIPSLFATILLAIAEPLPEAQ